MAHTLINSPSYPGTILNPGTGYGADWPSLIKLASGTIIAAVPYGTYGALDATRFYSSSDGGLSWTLLSTLANGLGAAVHVLGAVVQVANGDVWAISYDNVNDYPIYYVSADNCATWGSAIRMLEGDADETYIYAQHGKGILMSNGDVLIPMLWYLSDTEQKCVACIYDTSAGTWSKNWIVNDDDPSYNEWTCFETTYDGYPRLVGLIRKDKLSSENNKIYRSYSDDWGVTWTTPTAVYTTANVVTDYWQTSPEAIKVGDLVYMAFWYRRILAGASQPTCYVAISEDDGVTFGDEITVYSGQMITNGRGGGATIIYLTDDKFLVAFHQSNGSTLEVTYCVRFGPFKTIIDKAKETGQLTQGVRRILTEHIQGTTLNDCRISLSQDIGDYWAGATTSAGAAGGTTVVDTALKAKANDWITDEAYDLILSGTYEGEERKISSLDNSTGALTVLAHGGQIAASVDYEVHRLFTPSEKKRALLAAAMEIFPSCYQEIWDESLVSGNWLKDGSFERWTTSTNLADWVEDGPRSTKETSGLYVRHGKASAKLDLATGSLYQDISNFSDLQYLRGKSVTFTCQVWCDTASAVRLSVNDGTTQTYSSYHAGDSAWTEDDPREDELYVTQTIAQNATQVTFSIHLDSASAIAYVDDARAISNTRGRLSIGYLWLAQNRPHQVLIEPSYYSQEEEWQIVRDYTIDPNGYLYIPTHYPSDRRLRIRGLAYLDFLEDNESSQNWYSIIALNEPQVKILSASAALYLYRTMSMPNFESGTRNMYMEMIGFWKQELQDRKRRYGMFVPPIPVHWGVY